MRKTLIEISRALIHLIEFICSTLRFAFLFFFGAVVVTPTPTKLRFVKKDGKKLPAETLLISLLVK